MIRKSKNGSYEHSLAFKKYGQFICCCENVEQCDLAQNTAYLTDFGHRAIYRKFVISEMLVFAVFEFAKSLGWGFAGIILISRLDIRMARILRHI